MLRFDLILRREARHFQCNDSANYSFDCLKFTDFVMRTVLSLQVMDNLRQLLTSTRGTMQMGLLTSLLEYAVKKQSEEAAIYASPVSYCILSRSLEFCELRRCFRSLFLEMRHILYLFRRRNDSAIEEIG